MSVMHQLEDSFSYIYERMANHIEFRIKSGELKPEMPLPAERRLADEYGVSLGTARRATERLRDRNLVVTVRSKGTFVAKQQDGLVHEETGLMNTSTPRANGSPVTV